MSIKDQIKAIEARTEQIRKHRLELQAELKELDEKYPIRNEVK